MIKRYAVDGSWVFCTSGMVWQKLKVSSQQTVRKHSNLAATLNDRVGHNMGGCPQMILAGALIVAAMAFFMAAAATILVLAGIVLINYSVCGLLTRPGMWTITHPRTRHQKQQALMVEAQIPCLLGGINTIIYVGDMILFAKFAQYTYYRKGDKKQDQSEFQSLIDEGVGLKEVSLSELSESLQNKNLWDKSESSGFRAKIFKDDLGRYVVSYRGTVTDNSDLLDKDIVANAEQGLHLESEQYNDAMELSREIDKEFPDDEVVLVGHSKGGGEAAAGGTITGRPTYTYNSAGLSEETATRYTQGSSSLADSGHIVALNSHTDVLSLAQDGKYFISGAISTIPLIGPLLASQIANMPQAAGKRTSLVTDTLNPVKNHNLDPLIRALEKKVENPPINVIAKDL